MSSTTKLPAAKSKIVVLALSPERLAKFPHVPTPKSTEDSTSKSSSPPTPAPVVDSTPADTPMPDAASTPMAASDASGLLAPPATGAKKKGVPGPKAGTKRGAAAIDGTPKPRGKPGPKSKKQKLGDMINDPNSKSPFATPAAIPKLGPKANMGAINAGLRALDRTGKPCRKWEKQGFKIRSFTGVAWDVPTWRAPKKAAIFAEDVKSDSAGSSDTKVKDESSAVSDKSGALPGAETPVALASSPAPVAAAL